MEHCHRNVQVIDAFYMLDWHDEPQSFDAGVKRVRIASK